MSNQTFSSRELGQFMTISPILRTLMLKHISDVPTDAVTLEPSAGTGELVLDLEQAGLTVDAFDLFPPVQTVCKTQVVERNGFDISKAYDLIYVNPPYAWTNNPDAPYPEEFVPQKWRDAYGPVFNIYMPFLHHMATLLDPGGQLTVVCPTVIMSHYASAPLKTVLATEGEITRFDIMGPCNDFFPGTSDIELCVFSWVRSFAFI